MIGATVPRGSVPRALWWDTGDHKANAEIPPYHYVRIEQLDDEHDLLLCGGEDHPVGSTGPEQGPEEERYGVLEEWARKHFPVREVLYRWSGQVLEPTDSIAYIGRNPFDKDNVYIVTGDSGNGLTHATIAGIMLCDLITERPNAWEKIYSPSRFKHFATGKGFLSELFGALASFFKTKPKPDEGLGQIGAGEGGHVTLGDKMYGAYHADDGSYHVVNTECTHLKCTVKWNADEKSWDCPCHGSRFSYTGKVLNGPANSDLPYHHLQASDLPRAEEEVGHEHR
jgi:nitrite reductase/ring-hydroxylating ferredoxin subunit